VSRQRTYWHLQELGRKPSEYDIVSSRLLYYPGRGFAVETPLSEWHRRYQQQSALRCRDWERFADPRATTYTSYVDLQRNKEAFVDGLLASIDGSDYDRALAPDWLARLDRVFAPLRYPAHGLQMVAAYVGALAPSGKLVIASLLQAGDELRRVQRLAYRLCQLQQVHPDLGRDARAVWERDPVFQPQRELIECLLVTYDWSEAFVALDLVVKPAFDQLCLRHFGDLARAHGDDMLQKLFWSLLDDSAWHASWAQALCALLIEDEPGNAQVIAGIIARWAPRARAATRALAAAFGSDEVALRVAGAVDQHLRERWQACGLPEAAKPSEVMR
jgi:toluene monooxygenase system protein E